MTNREMFNERITSQCEKVVAMSDEELLNRIFKYGRGQRMNFMNLQGLWALSIILISLSY